TFTRFNELSFEEMLKRASSLPPRSAIFFALLVVDAAGVAHEEGKALAALHGVANAPIFAAFDPFLGQGIVGGPLTIIADLSRRSSSVAVRIMGGETRGAIRVQPNGPGGRRY